MFLHSDFALEISLNCYLMCHSRKNFRQSCEKFIDQEVEASSPSVVSQRAMAP